ncbi:MAG: hypothetical protein V3V28_09760 [Polaribacter sp.]|uniref:hypothetical protein n=1 Tax=Polaribacter sp. TaxID=1920175 RepID=UPI002F35F649
MKKIILLLTVFTMVFTSCEPLEDIYSELDAQKKDGIVGDITRTLSDDDYSELSLSSGDFKSEEDAKLMLPAFLTSEYPALGVSYNADGSIKKASSAAITYKLFSPIKFETYTVSAADYSNLGVTSLNHSGNFNDFFDAKFPSEAKGTVVDLTYQTKPTIIDYTLTDDDFDLVGNGRFDNFDIRVGRNEETIEVRRTKIQTILLNNFPNAEDGSKYNVTYAVYDGSAGTLEMLVKQQKNEPNASLTTDYTLTDADFTLVGNGRFKNFDIRQGRAEETIEARRAKIEMILLNNNPTTATGDLYNVTYAVWEGFASTRVMLVEFNGTGYDIFSTTSYELYTFALEEATTRFTLTDKWAAPITFTSSEYVIMGQRFPNFSDTDEAIYNIGIYLRTLYPFATPDTFVAVEYNYYNSGVSQRNVNYVFDGSVWNAVPSVIDTVLQFGHNGTTWVPDNTIKYTLTNADYTLVGNGSYGNFDVRAGKDEETVESRRVKINTILLANFPQYGVDQKFSVSYNVWKPGDDVFVMNLIHDGTEYILQ